MSVTSTTNYKQVTLTAVPQDISTLIHILDEDWVVVDRTRDGTVTTLTNTVDYEVDDVGDASGCTVTILALDVGGCEVGDVITVTRSIPRTVETSYSPNSRFSSTNVGNNFDKNVMVEQDQDEVLSRTVKMPRTATAAQRASVELDLTADVGKYLSLGSGGVLEWSAIPTTSGAAPSYASIALMQAADLGVGDSVLVTDSARGGIFVVSASGTDNDGTVFALDNGNYAHRRFDGPINVKWFGVVGDGSTDDSTALQAAFDYNRTDNSAGGAIFLIPEFDSYIKVTKRILIPGDCTIHWYGHVKAVDWDYATSTNSRMFQNRIREAGLLGRVSGTSITPTSGGTGYVTATNVPCTGGSGTKMTVDITAAAGVVTAITINSGGRGYLSTDTVTVYAGNLDCTLALNTAGVTLTTGTAAVDNQTGCASANKNGTINTQNGNILVDGHGIGILEGMALDGVEYLDSDGNTLAGKTMVFGLLFLSCDNVKVQGLNLVDHKGWHLTARCCTNVSFINNVIDSGRGSSSIYRNGRSCDGIHFDTCHDCIATGNNVTSSDDAFSVTDSFPNWDSADTISNVYASTRNIIITDNIIRSTVPISTGGAGYWINSNAFKLDLLEGTIEADHRRTIKDVTFANNHCICEGKFLSFEIDLDHFTGDDYPTTDPWRFERIQVLNNTFDMADTPWEGTSINPKTVSADIQLLGNSRFEGNVFNGCNSDSIFRLYQVYNCTFRDRFTNHRANSISATGVYQCYYFTRNLNESALVHTIENCVFEPNVDNVQGSVYNFEVDQYTYLDGLTLGGNITNWSQIATDNATMVAAVLIKGGYNYRAGIANIGRIDFNESLKIHDGKGPGIRFYFVSNPNFSTGRTTQITLDGCEVSQCGNGVSSAVDAYGFNLDYQFPSVGSDLVIPHAVISAKNCLFWKNEGNNLRAEYARKLVVQGGRMGGSALAWTTNRANIHWVLQGYSFRTDLCSGEISGVNFNMEPDATQWATSKVIYQGQEVVVPHDYSLTWTVDGLTGTKVFRYDSGVVTGTGKTPETGGTGYSDDTAVATTGGSGSGLTVDTTTSAGVITSFDVNAGGTGYEVGDIINITGGGANAFYVLRPGDFATVTPSATNIVVADGSGFTEQRPGELAIAITGSSSPSPYRGEPIRVFNNTFARGCLGVAQESRLFIEPQTIEVDSLPTRGWYHAGTKFQLRRPSAGGVEGYVVTTAGHIVGEDGWDIGDSFNPGDILGEGGKIYLWVGSPASNSGSAPTHTSGTTDNWKYIETQSVAVTKTYGTVSA